MNPFKWLWNKITTEKHTFDVEREAVKKTIRATEGVLLKGELSSVKEELEWARAELAAIKEEIAEHGVKLEAARAELVNVLKQKVDAKTPIGEAKAIERVAESLTLPGGTTMKAKIEKAKENVKSIPEDVAATIEATVEKIDVQINGKAKKPRKKKGE